MRYGWLALPLLLIAALAATAEAAKGVRERLVSSHLVSVDWDATLIKVVQNISESSGAKVELSRKAKAKKGATKVRVNEKDVAAKKVLDRVTEDYGLAWRVRGDTAEVILRSEITATPIVHFYDVSDLVDEDPDADDAFTAADIVKSIEAEVVPWSWNEIDGSGVRTRKKVIVVVALPDVQIEVGHFLADLRRAKQNAAR